MIGEESSFENTWCGEKDSGHGLALSICRWIANWRGMKRSMVEILISRCLLYKRRGRLWNLLINKVIALCRLIYHGLCMYAKVFKHYHRITKALTLTKLSAMTSH